MLNKDNDSSKGNNFFPAKNLNIPIESEHRLFGASDNTGNNFSKNRCIKLF